MVTSVVFQLGVGTVLLVLGWWGRRHVASLTLVYDSPEERRRREQVLIRGTWACQAVGVVFYVMIAPLFLA
ncbi:MAG: hypothetical protein QOI39_4458 [Mycobacterium sp.]|jgi:hypothetical protein|nr:hypothetical protein [Mycobacterium sp.]